MDGTITKPVATPQTIKEAIQVDKMPAKPTVQPPEEHIIQLPNIPQTITEANEDAPKINK